MIPKHVNLWEQPDLFSTPSSRWRAQCCLSLLRGQPTLIVDENCRFTHFACYSLSRFVLFNHGSVFTRSCEKHEQVVIFFSFCYLLPQPQRANTLAHTSPPRHGQITFSFHQSGGSSRTINPTGDAVRGSRNEQQ